MLPFSLRPFSIRLKVTDVEGQPSTFAPIPALVDVAMTWVSRKRARTRFSDENRPANRGRMSGIGLVRAKQRDDRRYRATIVLASKESIIESGSRPRERSNDGNCQLVAAKRFEFREGRRREALLRFHASLMQPGLTQSRFQASA